MNKNSRKVTLLIFALAILVLLTCAPNNEKFEMSPAGFWAGLWHGVIAWITFIISLFSDSVTMYEVNNNGAWYNLGFLLGLGAFVGGGCGGSCHKGKRSKSKNEKEWEEIGKKVEEKVKKGIKNWVDESEEKKDDWEEIGKKVEEKIKRELRNWAEK